ncbi:MAG: hypothetical protein IJX22_03835 [Opitutales bacterium]|nr:hypothetical protein [Opitutales bacterium]
MVIQPFLCAVNWGVVGWVLVGTIALLVVVAAVGRAIAAAFPPNPEHVSSFRKPMAAPAPVPVAPVSTAPVARVPVPVAAPVPAGGAIPPDVMAVIAASVAVVLRGQRFSITGVEPAQKTADIERLMSLWSLEGRRQVYSSHSLPR